ncbi:uncharacterized protein LY79DRAFT_204153 [Colletotrichum navitas]|uniref:Uncharacterized protein n=1 Tax=Colletotrichum navitas TaxID=681940 RepID=A0AAD8VBD5_9PEZI|nr:uncharacterized protein LY79DRAFT_204153 [Colletotrichum navitas]KAK1598953.1 hypothetical protein LY79DRAFT_204153 [Colletotrichum navitas]
MTKMLPIGSSLLACHRCTNILGIIVVWTEVPLRARRLQCLASAMGVLEGLPLTFAARNACSPFTRSLPFP